MKAISVYDLKLIPELAHLTPFDIIHPDNDKLVNPFLAEMGFDLDYPLIYTASQHRTLTNEVKVGYVIRGEVNINRNHLNGPWATLEDRMVAAAHQDMSLCRTLCEHKGTALDYGSFHDARVDDGIVSPDFPANQCEPEEQKITAQIRQLEELLLHIRGSQFNAAGDYKMPHEYHEQPAELKKRKKKNKEGAE